MSIVFSMLPFFLCQILCVKGYGHSHFPTGKHDEPIRGEKLEFNLEDVALAFLYNYADQIGANVWDVDVMGANSDRPEKNKYPPVKATMSPLTYGAAETVSTNPLVAYTQLFHNGQPDRNETATIHKEIKHHNTYTYSVERGIDTGLSGSFSAGIPEIVGASSEISVKFSTLWGSTKTETTETTYSVNQKVNVPPESTVQVLLIVNEDVVDVPWTATMNLKGYFAGYFEKHGVGKFWKYFPLGDLRHPDVETRAYNEILFRAQGTFHGLTSKTSRTVSREKYHHR
uniref:Putative cytotoxin-like protein n=1 Tax=Ixodes ricinus TaxID=34613 RepID=A0A6B0V781_IXORI